VDKKVKQKDGSMPLLDHLRELRMRLIVSVIGLTCTTVVAFILYDYIIEFLYNPFTVLKGDMPDKNVLFVNTIFEGFIIKIKVSVLAGLIFSLPLHLYNIVKFIFPGLTSKEKKVIIISLISSFFLIGFSAYYSYYKIIPISIRFLTNQGFIPENVGLLLNFGRNIFYIFQFIFATLIVFQIPILLEVLMVMDIVQRKTLLKIAKFVVIGIFVLSAALTPPDPVSQISVALPLILLYFITILIAKVFRFGEG